MFKTILFDLDGTLTESGIGITRSVAYALKKHGIEETDQKKLDRFVGTPLIDSFMRFYGFTAEQAALQKRKPSRVLRISGNIFP